MPLVSIIVAVRNAAGTLGRTLESATGQDYPNKEVIVIDGASTDGTLDVAARFRDRLAVLLSEPDEGIADAYNKGVRHASGEWIYFLNADDVFASPTILSELFTGADYAGCDLVVGKVLADNGRVFDGRYRWTLLIRNTVHHQAIFYRASVLRRAPYNTQYRRYGHDHEHNLRLWKAGVPAAYVDKTIAHWKCGGVSDTAKWRDYREEFHVRRNVVGRAAWLWNGFTLARYGLKRARLAVHRLR